MWNFILLAFAIHLNAATEHPTHFYRITKDAKSSYMLGTAHKGVSFKELQTVVKKHITTQDFDNVVTECLDTVIDEFVGMKEHCEDVADVDAKSLAGSGLFSESNPHEQCLKSSILLGKYVNAHYTLLDPEKNGSFEMCSKFLMGHLIRSTFDGEVSLIALENNPTAHYNDLEAFIDFVGKPDLASKISSFKKRTPYKSYNSQTKIQHFSLIVSLFANQALERDKSSNKDIYSIPDNYVCEYFWTNPEEADEMQFRHDLWMARILNYEERYESTLYLVGTAHLGCKKGILSRLQLEGFIIEELKSNGNFVLSDFSSVGF